MGDGRGGGGLKCGERTVTKEYVIGRLLDVTMATADAHGAQRGEMRVPNQWRRVLQVRHPCVRRP